MFGPTSKAFCVFFLGLVPFAAAASAQTCIIDNDVTAGTFGHFRVCVGSGGEALSADITGIRADNMMLSTSQVIFDYFTYIDVGNNGGGFLMVGTLPGATGDDEVTSTGSFTGAGGNTINWTAVSSIPDGGDTMTTVYSFTAATGTLGTFRLLQYLDEDVLGFLDDFFYTRGSLALDDLELVTIDNSSAMGVSHGGAFANNQGLANSTFGGWAASTYNNIKPKITGGGQPVSLVGTIEPTLSAAASVHPIVGSGYGPRDIVSVMVWDVDPSTTSATIITTLGGVPDAANAAPVAVCSASPTNAATPSGTNITVDCDSTAGRNITLDASLSTDPDGDTLSFTWSTSDALVILADPSAAVTTGDFPLGTTTATVTVTDGKGGVDVCDVMVTVQDVTPPSILCTTDVASLWPPRHNMVPVQVIIVATDPCLDVVPVILEVTSDEPDNARGNGDGNTTGDVDGMDGFSGPVSVAAVPDGSGNWVATIMLRAERAGSQDGRKYTINAMAEDDAANWQ